MKEERDLCWVFFDEQKFNTDRHKGAPHHCVRRPIVWCLSRASGRYRTFREPWYTEGTKRKHDATLLSCLKMEKRCVPGSCRVYLWLIPHCIITFTWSVCLCRDMIDSALLDSNYGKSTLDVFCCILPIYGQASIFIDAILTYHVPVLLIECSPQFLLFLSSSQFNSIFLGLPLLLFFALVLLH